MLQQRIYKKNKYILKYCIIIPTYYGHYDQIDILLNSFSVNCLDKSIIPIRLIISKNDENIFRNLIDKYIDLDLDFAIFSDILKEVDNIKFDEDYLLSMLGKYNFQSLKKLYGVKYFSAEISLTTDSESILIKKCYFEDFFKNYKKCPFIIHSKMHKRENIQLSVTNNSFNLFNSQFEDLWFLDSQYWFYERDVINDFFVNINKLHGNLFSALQKKNPIFDFCLYSVFIYLNNIKYNYSFLDMDKILFEKMSELEFKNHINELKAGTTFEYFPWHLNESNFQIFKDIYRDYKLPFFKFDDRFNDNYKIQQKFVSDDVYMLSCRVVCNSFKIDDFDIPVNHNLMNGQPIIKN